MNKAQVDAGKGLPKYFKFDNDSGSLDYTITSVGHAVGVRTEYPKSWVRRYTIKLRKNKNLVVRSESCPSRLDDMLRR